MRWHVVQTQPRQERVAFAHLARQGFTPYLPLLRKTRRHARRTDVVTQPLFPGYLFAGFDPDAARWRAVNGTTGCLRLICCGDRPAALPERVIEAIRAREDTEGFVTLNPPSFLPGMAVRIVEGPFADLTGLFEARTDQERVVLLLNLLGRPTRVTVPAFAVEAA